MQRMHSSDLCFRSFRPDNPFPPPIKFPRRSISHGRVAAGFRVSLSSVDISSSVSLLAIYPSRDHAILVKSLSMSIYKGITPKGYLVMVMASIGAILFVSHTSPVLGSTQGVRQWLVGHSPGHACVPLRLRRKRHGQWRGHLRLVLLKAIRGFRCRLGRRHDRLRARHVHQRSSGS